MATKQKTPHARASEALDTPANVLAIVEGLSARWWQGSKDRVTDTVA